MPSALAARGRRLRSVGCTRALRAPVAGSSPSLRRPSRCHLDGVCLQNTVCHCAPFTPTVPRMSSAARGSSSQKCMRSSCVRKSWLRFAAQAGRGSAPVPAFALSLRRPPASRPIHTRRTSLSGALPQSPRLRPRRGTGVVLKGTPVPRPVAASSICIGPGGEPKALPLRAPPPWAAHRGGLVGDSPTQKAGSTR